MLKKCEQDAVGMDSQCRVQARDLPLLKGEDGGSAQGGGGGGAGGGGGDGEPIAHNTVGCIRTFENRLPLKPREK